MSGFLIRMRRTWLMVAMALAVLALVPAVASAQAVTTQLRASLTGAGEVPPTTTTATGTFTATLDETAGTLTWTLTVPSITSATAAHLHAGAAGTNGGIVLPLFAAPSGSPASTINVSGTARQADLSGTLAGNFAEFARALKAGTIYANVHTTANPGGEIRAQVTTATQAAPTVPPTAAAAAAPAAPKTGNAGLAGRTGDMPGVVALLAVLTAGVVVGGRMLAGRRRAS